MKGLKDWEPDSKKRYKHIMENIIYVVDINPKNLWIYYNIFDEKNELEMNYYLGSFLEEGFDNHMKDVWKIDKWDLICTNPPYQSGSEDIRGSKSIYNIFIEKSHIIADKTIMITPSRWFSNIDLKIFREKMINSFGLKILKHYENGCDIFGKNIEIKGGVSYFLLDKNYCGDVLFNEKHITFSQNIISTDNISTLIEKIIKTENISSEFNSGSYFKIETNDKRVSDKNDIKCFMSKNNGYIKYISKSDLDIKPNIKKWKVLIPSASGSKNNIGSLGNIRIAKPNEVCSASFVHFAFDTELESTNFSLYIKTNLIKYLIKLRKPTQRVKKDIFEWVPKLDFTRTWTDEELYNYFNLTQEEIDLIEKTIK
jgi:site-specific DNA-methyltransferase (adenine-specific)